MLYCCWLKYTESLASLKRLEKSVNRKAGLCVAYDLKCVPLDKRDVESQDEINMGDNLSV